MDNGKRKITRNHYNFEINTYKSSESQDVVYNKTFILTDSSRNLNRSVGNTVVIINNCTFKGKVVFKLELIEDSVEIFFENCDFQCDIVYENLEKDDLEKLNINFKHCLLQTFQVTSKKCGRLTFTDCYLLNGLMINQSKFSFFEYCDSYSSVDITNSQCNSWRFIKNRYLYKKDRNKRLYSLTKNLKLENKITISNQANVRVQTIYRTEEDASYEKQQEWKLKYKSINLSLLNKCDVLIWNASIQNLTLMSCQSIGFTSLNCLIHDFTMSNVSPEKMNINNLKPFSEKNSNLKILNSILDNTTFQKVPFGIVFERGECCNY